jgi:hypothetical protein
LSLSLGVLIEGPALPNIIIAFTRVSTVFGSFFYLPYSFFVVVPGTAFHCCTTVVALNRICLCEKVLSLLRVFASGPLLSRLAESEGLPLAAALNNGAFIQ